ncbi:MAG: tRNA 4-thiouridine(8) synthase ThiI [candidate division WOR-3 bacterium]|jgi:tRNA U34 2-thiouridine synthase MnmA/TrmU
MINSRNSKAVGLFSGSLDSILAFKLITEQRIAAVALNFKLPFPVIGRVPTDDQLQELAKLLNITLVSITAGDEYLELVRTPKFGYIRELAPCIDCMAYMLRHAKTLMNEIHADFVFTGEVLGQRFISQSKRTMKLLEKTVGLEGKILRPLSAKILEPTIPELTGLIRRERLLDFHGRNRRRQIRLAREFGIVDYPTPGAGCLLTDPNFAARCQDAIDHGQFQTIDEIQILHYGRHFRLASKAKVIAGRNEEENRTLESLARSNDLIFQPVETVGPVVILRTAKPTKKDMEIAARICARYCDHNNGKPVKIAGSNDTRYSVKPFNDEELDEWRVNKTIIGKVARPNPDAKFIRKEASE